MKTLFLAVIACWVLGSAASAGAGFDEQPGQRFEVRPADMPRPYASSSAGNGPAIVARAAGASLRVPEGFAVNAFATGLRHARWLAVAPNGDVFLAEPSAGRITVLRDGDGDGVAELVSNFGWGFDRPHGMAFAGDYLYVADLEGIWRARYAPGDVRARTAATRITPAGAFGRGGGHWTRNLVISPDKMRIFVAIGSRGNIDVEPAPRATVQEFSLDGTRQHTFASGLRNPVGIAFYPGTEDLYVVVNERDGLGDGLVPDYLTRVVRDGFYGWPYSYIGGHPQPGFAGRRPDLVARALVPDVLFQSHSAPLGLVFYDGDQFPSEYRGDAFVALHGSWNASRPTGYKIVRVPFRETRPVGGYENFATGFWIAGADRAQVWGRPAGLAVAKDGSLLIADDVSNTIWRVRYQP